MTGKQVDKLAGDRGYRGIKQIGRQRYSSQTLLKLKTATTKRERNTNYFVNEQVQNQLIGHLKADHRLSRNFYKGVKGDAINVLLAAAAYNFKRAMRVLLYLIKRISIELVSTGFMLKYSF